MCGSEDKVLPIIVSRGEGVLPIIVSRGEGGGKACRRRRREVRGGGAVIVRVRHAEVLESRVDAGPLDVVVRAASWRCAAEQGLAAEQ
jgi:hypothetical protein